MENKATEKRVYEAPALVEVGSFESLTQALSAGSKTDVPLGTPATPNSPIFS